MISGGAPARHGASRCLDDAVLRLIDRGLLVNVGDVEQELARQQESLARLRANSEGSVNRAYLCTYDSVMRIAEIVLVTRGHKFGDHPHRALKELSAYLLGRSTEIETLVDVRHRTKKSGYRPTKSELTRLRDFRLAFEMAVGRIDGG